MSLTNELTLFRISKLETTLALESRTRQRNEHIVLSGGCLAACAWVAHWRFNLNQMKPSPPLLFGIFICMFGGATHHAFKAEHQNYFVKCNKQLLNSIKEEKFSWVNKQQK